ncbi:disease resistance protein At4g27190-like isoform X4 [Carya illinoinensis]|nr:disease resistance protein At4g27190-like isoform X4 [Carya illinoinensis]
MAENIVISVVAKIAEYTVAPVGRWLCYSFHFNSNIENLKNQEKNLRDAKDRVQHSVDVALRNEEEIYPAISKWLIDVDRIIELATRRLCESEEEAGTGSSNAACLNIKQRHQLSQEAKKIVENIAQLFAELHNNRNFEKVSHPTLPSEGMDYNNIENLKKQLEKLQHARERVRHSVDAALRNGEEIYSDVSKWLTDVDRITELATKTLCESEEEASTRSSNAACLNLQQRHQISREAKKMAGDIAELLKNGKFDRVAHHPPSQNMAPEQNEDYITLGSRMSVMKRIMEALGDANIKKIGVSGLAGVGKSTLMEEICRQVKEKRLFDEVALAKVTDSPNLSRIREEIAEMLNLQFNSNETEIGRANRLRTRLKKDNEILVILDDIWKQLDLNAIGIPSRGCKLLLTSRDQRVLASHMGTEKNIELDILGEEEAWTLFEKMAGVSFKDDPDLQNEAIKVAKECAGLPIALVTVSRALKDHKSLRIWKDALVQLRRPPSEHDTEIWSPVYSCIELSYKHLVGKEVKSLFLLCAQQGYVISYRDLLRYSFGLRLFHGIDTLEEASNRLEKLVSNLQDSCLLIQSPHSSNEFYMHDVVRHVATMIASNDHNMFVMRGNGGQTAWPYVDALKKCEALSIRGAHHIHKYPNKIECPKLRYFHVQSPYLKPPSSTSFQGMDKLEDIFFQGMDKLEVLSLKNIQLSSLLPLTNLQTLCLDRCTLGDIHWIGKLKTLVILSLARSDISNLPREIESLTRLQLLDLSYCFRLRVIPPNVLSSLVDLEELYMRKIKVEWEVEGPSNEGKNASLAELKKLSHLTTLEIDILNANNLPANLFSEKLERYKICIGDTWPWETLFKEEAFSIMLKLKLNMSFQLDFGIKMLLKRTEYLYLDESNSSKSVLYELHREDFQQLKHLHIQNNGNIKHIPELRTPDVAFPILEVFFLKNMFSLEEICQGKLPLLSFKNLKVLVVENCEKLRFIFSSSIARGLSLLEELNITRCNNMGAIFVKEEEDGIEDQGDTMLFGRLQTLVLKYLPKLVGFLSTKDSFMADCRETNSEGNHDLQLPLLHHDQVSLPSLQTLCMEGLPKIKHVWSCGQEPKTVFTGLEQLKILEITNCGVEEIVAVEGGEVVAIRTFEFPRVSTLELRNLKRLKWFYKAVHVSKWPMVKKLKIERCEEVEIFASGVVSFEETIKERQSEMSIKQPLFLVDELSFPSLKMLDIWKMDKLEIIWQDQVAATSFPNIQELKIFCCKKLLHVFHSNLHTTTTTLIHSLTNLDISYCSSLETIFGNMEGQNGKEPQVLMAPSSGTEESVAREDGTARHIEFPILTRLSLIALPKLKWIFEGVHTNLESWPSLKELSLGKCGEQVNKMIWASKFASSSSSQENQLQTCIQQPMFVVEKGTFPNLEHLLLVFRRITIRPSRFSDFPDPSFLLTRLPNLLKLNVYDSVWEEIFPYELVDREIRLRRLTLCRLRMLTHLWKEDSTQPCQLFHNLQYLDVSRCGKLKNLVPSSVSLRNLTGLEISHCHGLINLLTSSTAKTLVQLQRMTVIDCKRITEIVAMEDGEANVAITFNKLTRLTLDGLPNLTHFCSGPYSFGFPSLDEVIVRCCLEMKTFSHGVLSTPKLTAIYDDNRWSSKLNLHWKDDLNTTTRCLWEESNQYDTRLLFRERVENFEKDEDHP